MTSHRFRITAAILAGCSLSACAGRGAAAPVADSPASAASEPSASSGMDVRLPYHVVRLENGLTLLVQPDSTMPETGVEVWTRGGAREEAPGQHGIAHLFEHDVPSAGRFARNPVNRDRHGRVRRGGGAGTDHDFLRFYQTVSPEGLEAALAFLADRMQLDSTEYADSTLAKDKEIVISELRRSMGTDWDTDVRTHLARGTFGPDHPYGHAVSGTEADVRTATLALMQDWHRRFLAPEDMLVIVTGDADPARAEALVRRHFGPMPPRGRAARVETWVPAPRAIRETLEKDVSRAVVYRRWPVAAWGTADADLLGLLAQVLGQRLGAATAEIEAWELAGWFTLRGEADDAAGLDSAEAALDATLARLLADGPAAGELARARAQLEARFARSLQRLSGRDENRAEALGLGLLFRGDAAHYRTHLARLASATPAQVREAGRRWLGAPGYVLRVVPRPARAAAGTVDRGATVALPPRRRPALPVVSDSLRPDGLRLLVVGRPQLPLAAITLAVDAGSSTDEPAAAGRARVALDAIARVLGDTLGALGGELQAGLDEDLATIAVSLPSAGTEEALGAMLAALEGGLPDSVLAAAITEGRTRLEAALASPMEQRERALGPGDGLGTRAGLAALTPASIRVFVAERWRAGGVIAAAGRVDAARLHAVLDRAGRSAGSSPARAAELPAPAAPLAAGATLVEYPSAAQAHILLVQSLPGDVRADPLDAELVSWALRQRLMANLRTAKGWSYEVYPFGVEVRRSGARLRFNIPVRTDMTAESIAEIRAEIRRLRDEPVSAEYLGSIVGIVESQAVTGGLTSLERLNEQLVEAARTGRPVDARAATLDRLARLTPADLQAAARRLLDPERLVWVVAGARTAMTRELREAGLEVAE